MRASIATAAATLLAGSLAACGGPASTVREDPSPAQRQQPQQISSQQGVVGSGRSIADAVQLCHMNGGPGRTDYPYIASYRCADGSVPLGGDPERGARARLGNVGPGPDGHVVDLYEIPCATGPVRIHVDAYHCGAAADTTIDMMRLSRAQLAGLAQGIRRLHADPSSVEATAMRRDLILWTMQTQQLSVVVCEGIGPLVPHGDSSPYMVELMLSLAAAVAEDGRDPADPVGVYVAGIQGLLVYYRAVLAQQGPAARDPQLDALAAMAQDGTLRGRLAQIMSGCDMRRLGVHFYR
jgi:hypothetical protein